MSVATSAEYNAHYEDLMTVNVSLGPEAAIPTGHRRGRNAHGYHGGGHCAFLKADTAERRCHVSVRQVQAEAGGQ